MTDSQPELDLLTQAAQSDPENSVLQIAAAYALDSFGFEEQAIGFYDRAYLLGPPSEERPDFLLGYGSTLKNVGRLEESEAVLAAAVEEFPEHQALPVFLALTQFKLGKANLALSAMLQHLLHCAPNATQLQSYQAAIQEYAQELQSA